MAMLKRCALFVLSLIALQSFAQAQDYPTRSVNILVPFAPGGGTDLIARAVGQKLEQRLGKSFVIENRPGAGTTIAAGLTAKAAPDGYTLMQATSGTMSMNPTIFKKLPYTPNKDLVPVALIAGVPFVLVVNPQLPVHNIAELVKLAKEKPLTYGSGGVGAFHHLNAELLSSMLGIKMTHVPNKGSVPAMTDLISGNV
jgi:tripartite-type tricarboxylate transporter receptor subunit TctC